MCLNVFLFSRTEEVTFYQTQLFGLKKKIFLEQKENKTKHRFQGPPWVLGAGIKWTRRMQGRNNAIEAAGSPSPLTALAAKLNPAVSSEPRSMGQLTSGQAT